MADVAGNSWTDILTGAFPSSAKFRGRQGEWLQLTTLKGSSACLTVEAVAPTPYDDPETATPAGSFVILRAYDPLIETPGGDRRVAITAHYGDGFGSSAVYSGTALNPAFAGSTVAAIAGGWQFTIRPAVGAWPPTSVELRVQEIGG
jgi:hypothetical protein